MPPHSHARRLVLLLLVLSTTFPDPVSSSCAGGVRDDAAIVAAAFRYVRNFRPQGVPACRPVRELRLPSRNLTGAVAWAALANLSALAALDLSGNALQGAIPGGFWRAPALRAVTRLLRRYKRGDAGASSFISIRQSRTPPYKQ